MTDRKFAGRMERFHAIVDRFVHSESPEPLWFQLRRELRPARGWARPWQERLDQIAAEYVEGALEGDVLDLAFRQFRADLASELDLLRHQVPETRLEALAGYLLAVDELQDACRRHAERQRGQGFAADLRRGDATEPQR